MAQKKKKKKLYKSSFTNPVAVAMMARYGTSTQFMTNRNVKRRNRKSWEKDEVQAWD